MTARLIHTRHALALVKQAYQDLQAAGAIHAAARVKTCLKSVEGAVRHAERLQGVPPAERRKRKRITVHRRTPYRSHGFGHDNTAYFPMGAFHR